MNCSPGQSNLPSKGRRLEQSLALPEPTFALSNPVEKPARFVAPSAKEVQPVTSAVLRRLFGPSSMTKLFSPQNVSPLGQIRLN